MPSILQVLPRLESGGVERGTIEITEAIKKAAMKPLVASEGGTLVPHITHAGGEHITLPLASKNPFRIRQNAWKLAKLIRTREIDLIHARSRAPAWSAWYASQQTGIPFVTTWHGIYGLESNFKRRYNSVMLKSDLTIAVSQFVMDHILTEYGADPAKLRLIHRGVDTKTFSPERVNPERIAQLTKSWRLPDEHVPIIFCPGRINRNKGQHVLIEALAQIRELDFLCIIAGSEHGHESYRESLEKQIVASGLEGKVRICNATPYMTEAYMLSHLVAVPSVQPESFGRVAIEAQSMGRLVIASDHGGARETIVANETGYLVLPGDAGALAEAIRFALHRDGKMTKAMAEFAAQHVEQHFSLEQMKQKTIAVYRELLA